MSWKKILKRIRREQRKRFDVTDYDSELQKKMDSMVKKMREIEGELSKLSIARKNAKTSEEDEQISLKINTISEKLKAIRAKMGQLSAKIIIRRRGSRDSK